MKLISAAELVKLAEEKGKWHYLGRWVQPTLSMCFWPLYTKRRNYARLGLPETVADNIQLDGHYLELEPNRKVYEKIANDALEKKDEAVFKKMAAVAEKACAIHLKLAERVQGDKRPLEIVLAEFFESMDEIIPTWMLAIYFGYASEEAVGKEMEAHGLKHLEIVHHFKPRETMLMKQEREAREFAAYLRDAGFMHLLDEKPEKAMGLLNANHERLARRISEHLEEFEWVGTHHCWGEPLTMERLFTQVREAPESKEEKREYAKLPEKLAWLIKWQNEFGFWRQYSAETSDVAFYKLRPLLERAGKQIGLRYDEIIWLSDKEILKALRTGSVPSKHEIVERSKGFGYIKGTDGSEIVITGERLHALVKIHLPKVDSAMREFIGKPGSRGFAVGTAFVCHTPQEAVKMEKGQILVVPQTTPDYVVVMKKAAAIVTDEGGVTCHAAIVSRELGIPCVVGTKVGTHLLKTGDKIEVDANTGIIRRL